MYFVTFEDATSVTYGATGDRPIINFLQVPDEDTAILNTGTGQAYVEVAAVIPNTLDYKVEWTGSEWQCVERDAFSTVASWNKTTITADGVDQAVLSGVPNPTTVFVEIRNTTVIRAPGAYEVEVTDGTFELTSNDTGDFLILIYDPFPYKPYTAEITAV